MKVAAMLEALRSLVYKPLPQPVEYLINDVGRRHGEVGVLGVGCVVVCFFFQAEDGIRDYKVTGVQTCALQISVGRHAVIFPAGEVSHFRWSDRTVTDGEWNTSVSRMVGIADVPVIPLYVEGT